MNEQRPDEHYAIQPGTPGVDCCYCECKNTEHPCGWKCPIFNGNMICSQCCNIDVLRKDAPEHFSKQLGREITREEINAACRDCGRNHAMESEAIADQLWSNSFKSDTETTHDTQEKNG